MRRDVGTRGGRRSGRRLAAAVLAGLLAIAPASEAGADCRVLEPDPDRRDEYSLRLGGDCTDADRQLHAVTASVLLDAIREGRRIDLVNVLVTGDLRLDLLPTVLDLSSKRRRARSLARAADV